MAGAGTGGVSSGSGAGTGTVGRIYGGAGGGGSNMSSFLQNHQIVSSSSSSSQPLDTFFIPGSTSSLMGSSSMVSFEDVCGGKKSQRLFFNTLEQDENCDDDYDEYFHQPEKKRRLNVEQVQFLEKSFEVENKLEPERKVQLAKDLGLQPRQVAIWFQNRRARWKNKQLEKDYDTLHASYNSLKTDYDSLLKEKDQLKAEILNLSDKLQHKEKEEGDLGGPSNTNTRVQTPPRQGPIHDSASDAEAPKVSVSGYNPEDLCSMKSDVFDSDSPRYLDAAHSIFGDYGDSSYVFETDQSELSQDEDDNLSMGLLPPSYVEDAALANPPVNSCNFSLPAVEDHASWIWSSY